MCSYCWCSSDGLASVFSRERDKDNVARTHMQPNAKFTSDPPRAKKETRGESIQRNSCCENAPRTTRNNLLHCGHLCQHSLYRWRSLRTTNRQSGTSSCWRCSHPRPALCSKIGCNTHRTAAEFQTCMFHEIRSLKNISHQRQTWVKNSCAYAIVVRRTQYVRTLDVSKFVHTTSGVNGKSASQRG